MKNLLPDDIEVGRWVVVTGRFDTPHAELELCGMPWRVLAVSLPFIAMRCGRKRTTIDVRNWRLGRVSKEYVRAILFSDKYQRKKSAIIEEEGRNDGHERCVRCGERTVQRLVAPSEWKWYCRDCGTDGNLVQASN